MYFLRNKSFGFLVAFAAMSLPYCGYAAVIVDEANTKAVNNVKWNKTGSSDVKELANRAVPVGATSLFFMRPNDNDNIQTSANIAINDRFQVSLQPGNFSQVYSCSGVNMISGEITGNKNNDLLKNAITFNLTPEDSYFFSVEVDGFGDTRIKHITKDSALAAMSEMPRQTHQISRVVPNCPAVPVATPLPVMPISPPLMPPMPPAQRHIIDLEVLFDTDKSAIKPAYFDKIRETADFMHANPQAVVTIEGHTDSRASDMYNQSLSQRRVDAVRQVLIDHFGITRDRINAVGYGESRPRATNDTAEGRQLNRRVIAVFDY